LNSLLGTYLSKSFNRTNVCYESLTERPH